MGGHLSKLGSQALSRDALPSDSEAYCLPCDSDPDREASSRLEPLVGREKSVVDDHSLAWARYKNAPSTYGGAAPFNSAGVQRIDLSFGAMELEAVAGWIDGKDDFCAPLHPFHRLGLPDRLEAWRAQFASLDLGTYEEACAESSAHLASLRWTILIIQPNRFFPAHQHPNVEVEFVLRGALYENRLLLQPDAPLAEASVPDGGFPRLFRVQKHVGGDFFSNPRYSVHQSYTMDEGVVLLVLWTGRHVNIADRDGALWEPGRCQNPTCPLECDAETFENFVGLGGAPVGIRKQKSTNSAQTSRLPGEGTRLVPSWLKDEGTRTIG